MTSHYWSAPVPTRCQPCLTRIRGTFYDAATRRGTWMIMCERCHVIGPGINRVGVGVAQRYEQQSDGRWLKTAG
jgi:hypothetical protein